MAIRDVIEGVASTCIAGGGYLLGTKTFAYAKKRDSKDDTRVEVKDAVAEENRITKLEAGDKQNKQSIEDISEDVKWIRDQLGKNPNGGNAMQQLLDGQRRNESKIDVLANDTGSKLLDLSKHILEIGANLTSHVVHHKEQ